MPRNMTRSEREAFLAALHVGVISVDGRSGEPPYAVPIWYAYEPGGLVTIMTVPGSLKVRLMEAAGAFTITVQDEALPYRYVSAGGPVVETVPVADPAERLALAQRYLGEEGGRAWMQEMESQVEGTYRMRPTRWRAFDFSD